MTWDQLPHYVFKLQCQVTAIRSNGFCFLHAVGMVLYMDHDKMVTLDNIESSILDHLVSNVTTTNYSIRICIKGCTKYFKFGIYCDNVLNQVVVATAKALNLNFTIYQKGPTENIQILEHITHANQKNSPEIYMRP